MTMVMVVFVARVGDTGRIMLRGSQRKELELRKGGEGDRCSGGRGSPETACHTLKSRSKAEASGPE